MIAINTNESMKMTFKEEDKSLFYAFEYDNFEDQK